MIESILPIAAQAQANLIGQGLNVLSTEWTNRKARKWNEKMYGRQRQDALSDWALQNEYNHPSNQMARLREAGLNPNLVYGKGADAQGGVVRSSNVQGWQPKAPQVDFGGVARESLSMYYDNQVKQAQIDNLKTQNTVLVQDAALKAAQVLATTATTDRTKQETEMSKFDLGLKQDLRDISLEAARAALDKVRADTKFTLDQNERAAAMQAPNLLKAIEEVANLRIARTKTQAEIDHIRQQVKNLQLDYRLRDYEQELKKQGIYPHDPMYARVIASLLFGESDFNRVEFPGRASGFMGGRVLERFGNKGRKK